MNCRISSWLIGSRASPSTVCTDNRYCAMVILLVMGRHFPPLTQLRTGLAQSDTRRAEGCRERLRQLRRQPASFEQPRIREAEDPRDPVALDLQHHQAVWPVRAVVATRVGGERRLPVRRGRYEADLVEPPALRHGSEEVADRARARDTHALRGH